MLRLPEQLGHAAAASSDVEPPFAADVVVAVAALPAVDSAAVADQAVGLVAAVAVVEAAAAAAAAAAAVAAVVVGVGVPAGEVLAVQELGPAPVVEVEVVIVSAVEYDAGLAVVLGTPVLHVQAALEAEASSVPAAVAVSADSAVHLDLGCSAEKQHAAWRCDVAPSIAAAELAAGPVPARAAVAALLDSEQAAHADAVAG